MDLSWGPTTAVSEGEMVIEVFTRYWRGNEIGDKEREIKRELKRVSEFKVNYHIVHMHSHTMHKTLVLYEIKCILNKKIILIYIA